MNGYGYESLVWIRDENGREFYCPADAVRNDFVDGEKLSETELKACSDVNQIVGTERW